MKKIKKIKKIKILFLGLILGTAGTMSIAYAQIPPQGVSQINLPSSTDELAKKADEARKKAVLMADVSVRDAQIIYNERNKFKIAFVIANKKDVQTGIKYAVQLLKKDERGIRILYDQKVFDETLTVNNGELLPVIVDYEAPAFAKGDFELGIVSNQANGLPLGQIKVADVKLDGNAGYVDLSDCYLTIDGSNGTKYTLRQGVDISKDEKLSLLCQAKNNFQDQISVTPAFETRFRSELGKIISNKNSESVSLNGGESRQITFPIFGETKAQSYDVALTLKNSDGSAVSNSIYFHYVIQGLSGTIQNLRLDKDSYNAGETAIATFAFSGSADVFVGARTTGTVYDKAKIELAISDSSGNLCTDKVTKEVSSKPMDQIEIDVPIKTNCSDSPTVSVNLKDGSGNLLDSFSAVIGKTRQAQEKTTTSSSTGKLSSALKNIVAVVTILALAIVILFYRRKKRISGINILLLSMLLALGVFYGGSTQAATFYTSTGYPYYTTFSTNLDRGAYSVGGTITVTGRATVGTCGNWHTMYIWGGIPNKWVIPPTWTGDVWGSQAYPAPPMPGNGYRFDWGGRDDALAGVFTSACGSTFWAFPPWCQMDAATSSAYAEGYGSDWFNVIPLPAVNISASPSAVCSGQGTTLSWSSANAAYCGLWGGPWNNAPIGASGSIWTGALSSNTTYTIGCHNNIDWSWASTTVAINPPAPTVSTSASPNPVVYGGASTISFSSGGSPAWCWLEGGGYATWAGASGQVGTGALYSATNYTYTCGNSCGQNSSTVSVGVGAAPCVPDSTCTSHAVNWGTCSASCGGGTATQTGTCDNGCSGTGSTSRTCTNNVPCCNCSSSENATQCAGAYTNSCGISCTGTKDCSEKGWREVSP